MVKLFVWDFHGVLEKGNSLAVKEISNLVLKKEGYEERFTQEHINELYGKKWVEYFKDLIKGLTEEEYNSLQGKCFEFDKTREIVKEYIELNDYAVEILTKIQKSEHEQILMSNTTPEGLPDFLESVGISDFFPEETAFGMDAHRADKGTTKEAELKKYLEDKHFDEIVVIGDSKGDMNLAKSVGATAILYHNPKFPEKGMKDKKDVIYTKNLKTVLNYV